MTLIKEYITLISAIFKNTPKTPLKHIEMKYVLWPGYKLLTWAGLMISRPGTIISGIDKNHEDIHRQQALVLGSYWKFYLLYLWEYLCNLFILWNFSGAYDCISYEIQAHGRQHKLDYKVTLENMKLYRIKNKRKIWKENKNNWTHYCKGIEA